MFRDGTPVYLHSSELVIGDAVLLDDEAGSQVVCDMVLIQGDCIMDESSCKSFY